jgi:hypothetical protein
MGCENCANSEKRWILKCAASAVAVEARTLALVGVLLLFLCGLVILARELTSHLRVCVFGVIFSHVSLCNGINQQARKRFTLLIKMNT